jgi:hypothetical protein
MSLQRSLIAHDHRPILDRLPSRIRFATGTGAKTLTLGGRNGGSVLLNADISDLYINWGTYLNPATELSKFRNPSTGKPVDLGANRATQTGASPIGLFSGRSLPGTKTKAPAQYLHPSGRRLTASSSNP